MRTAVSVAALVPSVLLVAQAVAAGGIYAFTDSSGVVHYSNVPADARFELLLTEPRSATQSASPQSILLNRSAAYVRLIKGAAQANRLEPALVTAVMLAESGGDPRAVSKRGASGLMQLMPATARQY